MRDLTPEQKLGLEHLRHTSADERRAIAARFLRDRGKSWDELPQTVARFDLSWAVLHYPNAEVAALLTLFRDQGSTGPYKRTWARPWGEEKITLGELLDAELGIAIVGFAWYEEGRLRFSDDVAPEERTDLERMFETYEDAVIRVVSVALAKAGSSAERLARFEGEAREAEDDDGFRLIIDRWAGDLPGDERGKLGAALLAIENEFTED